MKYAIIGLAMLAGTAGVGYCQSQTYDQSGLPVHPGTALLDSMGIYAGEPQPAQKADAKPSAPAMTVIASPNNATGQRQ